MGVTALPKIATERPMRSQSCGRCAPRHSVKGGQNAYVVSQVFQSRHKPPRGLVVLSRLP
eukprot:355798-Chlamydomonas_euryale.AAC.6